MNPCENYCKPFSAQCQLGILISPWKSRIAVGFQNVPLFASDEMLVRKESSFIQGKLILGVIYSLLFLFLSPHLLLSSLQELSSFLPHSFLSTTASLCQSLFTPRWHSCSSLSWDPEAEWLTENEICNKEEEIEICIHIMCLNIIHVTVNEMNPWASH